MKRFLFWTLLSALSYGSAIQAQPGRGRDISGSVTDSNQSPLPLVTIRLYYSPNVDHPLAVITSDNKGKYKFADLDTGKYVLILTHTNYNEAKEFVTVSDSVSYHLKTILVLVSKNLQEVTVTAVRKKPIVIMEEDRLIYSAEDDPANMVLNTLELLRKTPMLTVDGDDLILLNGQTNFRILLNGRETGMFSNSPANALKAFPAKLVKRIEVITSPSAKWDAEGIGGLINIITAKKVVGYNGHVGVNHNKFNTIPFFGINLKYGKFAFSGSGGYNNARTPEAQFYTETVSFTRSFYKKRFSAGFQNTSSFSQWGNIEGSLELDSLKTIVFYGGISGGHGKTIRGTDDNILLTGTTGIISGSFQYYSNYQSPVHSWGADYIHRYKIDKNRELSLKYYAQYGKNNGFDTGRQLLFNQNRYIINDNTSKDRQETLQADYVLPLSGARRLEAGVKLIFRGATALYKNYSKENMNSEYTLITGNSDNFAYKQKVYSIYSTYRFSWRKISFRLGARLEHTIIKGDFFNSATSIRQSYNSVLPNIFLSKQLKPGSTISLVYGLRLARPYIYNLNPFIRNTDSLSISYGNPELNAQYAHNLELGYTVIKGSSSLVLKLSETYSNNAITRYSFFDSQTGIAAATYANIGISTTTGFTINLSTKLSAKWYLYLNGSAQYVGVRNRSNRLQNQKGFAGNGSISTGYSFTSWFSSSVFFWFMQAPPTFQTRFSANYTATWNATFELIKNKVSVSLTLNNPFPTNFNVKTTLKDPDFMHFSHTVTKRRALGISASWNFGKLSENTSRKKGVKNEDLF